MGASSGGDAGAIPLTDIILSSYEIPERFLPDWLLGGSAPRLRLLQLDFISLPVLLLSATHLVHLRLHGISSGGYISPKEIVTCLSTLASLESLFLGFLCCVCPATPADENHLSTRAVFPALTVFAFRGIRSYLEDFVARLQAPENAVRLHHGNPSPGSSACYRILSNISRTQFANLIQWQPCCRLLTRTKCI
ncbi:hypothetical protein BGY98DRAFT_949521 [Russula aff. rugulosa BPL654]|nr:hypothetical protein BGY98DRAFT_949521 [Russula aff. rugulosa BPL654]